MGRVRRLIEFCLVRVLEPTLCLLAGISVGWAHGAFQQGAVPTWDLVPVASGAFLRERGFRRNPRGFLVSVL